MSRQQNQNKQGKRTYLSWWLESCLRMRMKRSLCRLVSSSDSSAPKARWIRTAWGEKIIIREFTCVCVLCARQGTMNTNCYYLPPTALENSRKRTIGAHCSTLAHKHIHIPSNSFRVCIMERLSTKSRTPEDSARVRVQYKSDMSHCEQEVQSREFRHKYERKTALNRVYGWRKGVASNTYS